MDVGVMYFVDLDQSETHKVFYKNYGRPQEPIQSFSPTVLFQGLRVATAHP